MRIQAFYEKKIQYDHVEKDNFQEDTRQIVLKIDAGAKVKNVCTVH